MAALTGNTIASSYQGILKTFTNNPLALGLRQQITDGAGNGSPLYLAQDSIGLTGDVEFPSAIVDFTTVTSVDFTGANIIGLPTGTPGLDDGTGTNAIASTLTDLPANSTGFASTAIGRNTQSTSDSSVAIGNYATASGAKAISIGSEVTANKTQSQAYGWNSTASANGAIALGSGIQAQKVDTTSTKALELMTNSTPLAGGIVFHDAGGTERRMNVDSSGNLQIDANPVAGPTPSNFTGNYWTHTGQDSQDIVYDMVMIPGGTYSTGDVLSVQCLEYRDGMNDWAYSSLWISDTAQVVGTNPAGGAANYSFGQVQDPGSRLTALYDKTLFITSAGTMTAPYNLPGQPGPGVLNGGDPCEFYNIDWTVDQYFFFQVWIDATAGTIQSGGISVTQRS